MDKSTVATNPPSGSLDAELAPIYAEVGAAVHAAQCLESVLALLMALATKYDDAGFSAQSVDELKSRQANQTLKKLFRAVRQREYFTGPEKRMIHKAIAQRNALVHSYLVEKAEYFLGARRRQQLLLDVREIRDNIHKARVIVEELVDRYLSEHDTSVESLKEFWEPLYHSDEEPPEELL